MAYSIINKVSSSRVPAWGNKHQFIAIHYLGCVGENYDLSSDGCGAHFTVFYDGRIYQRCSYDAVPWAVGTAGYYTQKHPKANNYNTISIEMCVKKTNNKGAANSAEDKDWYFTKETQEATVWLVQKLMSDLNIPIQNVLRHFDICSKTCPAPYVHNNKYKTSWTWDEFKAKVLGTEVKPEPFYRVRKSWEDAKSQLGAYTVLENAKKNCPTGYYVFDESGKIVYPVNNSSTTPPTNTTHGTQSSDITGTETEKAAKMLEMVHKCDKSGILYSVTTAQMILESGYCTTELSKLANNCFGMKVNLSGNTWESVWDGSSKVNIRTPEQDIYGNTYYINADFRKYKCIEDSIKDHSCYLLGAMNGSKKRYEGLTKCKDYKSAIILIKNGKYASDVSYVSKICNIIQRFGLDKYDKELTGNITETPSTTKTPYRVATAYSNGKYTNQVGAYDILDNAKKTADSTSVNKKKTYYVYDNTGAIVYTATYTSTPSQSISTSKITKVSEWISTIKNWEQKMINVKAVYSNNGNKTDYTVALKQSPVTTNCALFVTHALQVAGIFDKKDKFYGSKGTSIKGSAASKMKEIGKVITYSKANMTTDKVDLRPGDILTYHEGHTNVYLGKDNNGKKQWSDAGRGTNIGCKEGSNWKSFRRTGEMSGYHVANIIRLNLADDISTSTSKPSTSKKLYDVKVKIPDLRIRKTPNGEILKKNGKEVYTGIGIFGITEEVKSGGYTWGRLLSGKGWIALSNEYVDKM